MRWRDEGIGSGRLASWNDAGLHVLYTSESRSLACLENMVYRNRAQLDQLFRVMIIDVSEQKPIISLPKDLLSPAWMRKDVRSISHCRKKIRNFKDELPVSTRIIKVPTAVVPGEFNYLLYPKSQNLSWLHIHSVEPFLMDGRL